MTAKEYLSQAFILDKKIKSKEKQLEALKTHDGYCSPTISDLPKGSPSMVSAVERTAMRLLELEEYIRTQIDELVRLQKEIQCVISQINNPECESVLEMRYLSFMSWDEITSRMGYASNYVFQIHRRALELIRIPLTTPKYT
jgi:DNA-directed RNA polymerase specialized sigma subunit